MAVNNEVKRQTYLSDDELEQFRTQLQNLKKEEESEIEELKKSADNISRDASDVQSSRSHHPGDAASDDQIRKTSYTLIDKKKEKIDKIIVALDRIDAGTYGICTVSGKPIQKKRLEAIPYAMHTVDAKEQD